MHSRDIIILHKSAVVQKGLNALLYVHQRSDIKSVTNFNDFSFLSEIKKSYLFADAELDLMLNDFRKMLLQNDNIVIGVKINSDDKEYAFPFNSFISIKDSETLLHKKFDAIFNTSSDEEENHKLTPREKKVLECVAKGMSSQAIADKLFISRHTVITHRKNICGKLGIKTVSGLTLYALVNKII